MNQRRPLRTSAALMLTVLMVGGSVVVPLIERADQAHVTVVESEHAPGDCPTGHDHTVCTQVGANAPTPTEQQRHNWARTVVRTVTPATRSDVFATPLADGHPTRGPPLA